MCRGMKSLDDTRDTRIREGMGASMLRGSVQYVCAALYK